ncbi:tripartite tricarboxylate transporter TctB family protein [Ancylobacter sonchi]|uniref:tripartite tricarboxylate transporter TctB family protein n=1 Tax=Ancylobacter sonchi TaxID=1937790 RepID=UPI001BD31C0E|nr:tripartite tricarboxylate transporter TctB family protein [Ancylobacter sonchi]MBS7534708.1 tripartite tricarboxylate transporter TctB family protein [Ancylobacter sonchi]
MSAGVSPRPWWVPGGVIAFGGVMLYGATQLGQSDAHSGVGPGLFVTIIGIALVVLGVALGVQVARGVAFTSPEGEDAYGEVDDEDRTHRGPLLLAIASLAAPLVLMQAAGFPVTAAVVFAGVARAFGSRRPVVDILTGAVLGAVAWFFFNWLGVNLGPFLPLLSER